MDLHKKHESTLHKYHLAIVKPKRRPSVSSFDNLYILKPRCPHHVYYMSLFKLPKIMGDRLDRIRGNFLWEDQSDKKKLHLIGWIEVIKPKVLCGFGLEIMESKNCEVIS